VSGQVIDAAVAVHKALGPGALESAYEACMGIELRLRGLLIESQLEVPIVYRGTRIDLGYRLDMLVNKQVVVELKAVSKLLPIHQAQLLSYMKLGGYKVGLLLNFHAPRMKDGILRLAN
jgi:GxxExxY protein